MSNMNLVCGLDSRIVWYKNFKLIENERCLSLILVNSFMQISVDVNEPFMIKCYATTQMKALLYIKLLMINTLFVEQISPQINFFTKNI